MQKWEYLVIKESDFVNYPNINVAEEFERIINVFGKDGYKLVPCVPDVCGVRAIMERERINPFPRV